MADHIRSRIAVLTRHPDLVQMEAMNLRIEPTQYRGWPNCWRVANGEVELIVTADVGPRVIRYGFPGGQNLLKNYDAQMGGTGEPEWMIRGGSRLWIAPEDP